MFRLVGQYKALHSSITATNPENSIKRLLFNVRWVLEFQGRHYKIEQVVKKNRTLILWIKNKPKNLRPNLWKSLASTAKKYACWCFRDTTRNHSENFSLKMINKYSILQFLTFSFKTQKTLMFLACVNYLIRSSSSIFCKRLLRSKEKLK